MSGASPEIEVIRDEHYREETITIAMVAAGTLVLLKYTNEFSTSFATKVALRVSCAERAAETRFDSSKHECDG
jgi:hypothetical protein